MHVHSVNLLLSQNKGLTLGCKLACCGMGTGRFWDGDWSLLGLDRLHTRADAPSRGRALASAGLAGNHWGMSGTLGLSRLNEIKLDRSLLT